MTADRAVLLGISTAPDAVFTGLGIQSGLLYALRHDGRQVAEPSVANYVGSEYEGNGTEQVVRIDVGTDPPREGRVIARMPVAQSPEPQAPAGASREVEWMAAVTLMPGDRNK